MMYNYLDEEIQLSHAVSAHDNDIGNFIDTGVDIIYLEKGQS
jgi:hypothetical protein